MVDHTFIFTGAVRKIKGLIEDKTLGDLYYYDSIRVNLGLFQHDVNVIWDLAPHDFSVMDFLVKEKPAAVAACGKAHVNGLEDTAYITVYFTNNMIAHFNVNWLSPVKVRTTLIGGEKRMLVWNDLEADEKIKDLRQGRGGHEPGKRLQPAGELPVRAICGPRGWTRSRRCGMRRSISVDASPRARRPINDGQAGLRVVKLLEACRPVVETEGAAGEPMNYLCIADDVKLGENVKLAQFINLYGCSIGDNTKIGTFVEIQKNAKVGRNCKIPSHTFICEGVTIEDDVFVGHNVTFINDKYPRATNGGRAADRSRTGRSSPRS